ncbi:MAG: hypothetical protein K2X55_26890, partial [Burkholderiaceae bacterium]|nr:hypothetical protein [Burkholderiaceae bacterium]
MRTLRNIRDTGAAAFGLRRKPRLRVVKPQTAVLLHAQPAAAAGEPPAPRSRRTRHVLILALLVMLSGLAWWGLHEVRTSSMQARFFSELMAKVHYKVEPGPSKSIRFPHDSPYDERLGYANMPEYLNKLKARDYEVAAQARFSPKMVELADLGLFTTYREKTRTGLNIV